MGLRIILSNCTCDIGVHGANNGSTAIRPPNSQTTDMMFIFMLHAFCKVEKIKSPSKSARIFVPSETSNLKEKTE